MTTTVRARRTPNQHITLTTPTPEAAQSAARALRQPATQRPRVPWQHHALFREPAYTDGQPYADPDDLGDDD